MSIPAWLLWGAAMLTVLDIGELARSPPEESQFVAFDDGYRIPPQQEYVAEINGL